MKKGFIKGEALRLLRTNSSETAFNDSITNFKSRLIARSYPHKLIQTTLSEVSFAGRQSALQQKAKARKQILPFVTTYHPSVCNLKNILLLNWDLIQNQPLLKAPAIETLCYTPLSSTSFILSFIHVMASKLDKADYVYNVENLSALMASMDADGTDPGACPKKSKQLAMKTAGKSSKAQPPPASSIESLLEHQRVKNENLKLELEITKAQLELAKMKSVSAKPWTPSLGQPHLLQAAITSTPGSALGSGIPMLEQRWEKKKPGSTLPYNFVFSSKGMTSYESLDLPDFVNGFLEFQKQQADACKPGLTKHLQLPMARASTYNWSSVRSFHLSIATAIDQGRLSWSDCDAICERLQTFFTHQDLRTQPRMLGMQQNQGTQMSQSERSNRDKKEKYYCDWNYTAKCNCHSTSAPR